MPIHDIDMDPINPGSITSSNIFAQAGKIS
jgi:hypothetical protein